MVETYVMLKPRDQWREGVTERKIWDEINAVATLLGITPASPLQPTTSALVTNEIRLRAQYPSGRMSCVPLARTGQNVMRETGFRGDLTAELSS